MDRIEVDHCDTCRGTYLDAGELERLRALDVGTPSEKRELPGETDDVPTAPGLSMWALLMGGTNA